MGFGAFICQLIALVVMMCISVVWNSFNLVMIIRKLKTKSARTTRLIMLSISISNNVLVPSCFVIMVSVSLNPLILCNRLTEPQYLTVLYLWLSSSCMSFWSIAWLSVFYCVKIVNFSTKPLRALKRNISFITNTALQLSCLSSFILFVPFFTLHAPAAEPAATVRTYGINKTFSTSNLTCSLPTFTPQIDTNVYTLTFLAFLCLFPLMIMLPTSVRMVIHLCWHVLELQRNQTRVQGLDSYLFVCKLSISLVGVYLTSLTIVAFFFVLKILGVNVSFLMVTFDFSFYCIMTAALLTASEQYLKKKFWSLCCSETCRNKPTSKQNR